MARGDISNFNPVRYQIRVEGISPLLMHWDNLEFEEKVNAWIKTEDGQRHSRAGDDRTPAWKWLGYLYNDGKHVAMPMDNMMTCLREGGVKVPLPAKMKGSYKQYTQSSILFDEFFAPLEIPNAKGKWAPVAMKDVLGAADSNVYGDHIALASSLGFSLFAKRAKVGQSKHVRVRPRFDRWAFNASFIVSDELLTEGALNTILRRSGLYSGLGDWRPSSKQSSGSFGRFKFELKQA